MRKLRRDARELSLALDVHVLRAVDENVGDRVVAEQRLDRAESGDLVDDLLDDLFALDLAERRRLGAQELDDGVADLLNENRLVLDRLERLEVQPLDEPAVQVDLELLDRAQSRGLELVRERAAAARCQRLAGMSRRRRSNVGDGSERSRCRRRRLRQRRMRYRFRLRPRA